jgi:hypothetical protein
MEKDSNDFLPKSTFPFPGSLWEEIGGIFFFLGSKKGEIPTKEQKLGKIDPISYLKLGIKCCSSSDDMSEKSKGECMLSKETSSEHLEK